eukprot:336093-Amphidinium_carterae.1
MEHAQQANPSCTAYCTDAFDSTSGDARECMFKMCVAQLVLPHRMLPAYIAMLSWLRLSQTLVIAV